MMPHPRVAPRRSAYNDMAHPVDAAPAQPHRFYLELFLGYGYVLSSLCLSFYYLQLLAPYLANDARLTNFNESGAHSFLIDAINRELEHPRLELSIWNITSTSIAKYYSTPNTPLLIPAGYARRALLDDTRIEAVIRRSLQASANTLSRLPTHDNTAVYLESTLRLANWDDWVAFHGGGFVPAIVSGMIPRESGQLWLGQVAATIVTDADMESAVWRQHNLTRYALQWQNYQQDGLVEYVAVSNGFGKHLIQVKHMEYSMRMDVPWSTWTGYWGAWNDWASAAALASKFNATLVTSGNSTSSVQALDFEFAVGVRSQLISASAMLIRRVLGPFLSIDMRHVALPAALVAYYATFPSPTGGTAALAFTMMYVSVVLAGLALVLAVYSVMNRWSVIGRNLFRFNRVAGCVWIGRPLLLARGMSAILLLSRDTLDLQAIRGVGTLLVSKRRHWVDSMVVVGEASWAVFVVHDLMLLGSSHVYVYGPLGNIVAYGRLDAT
ncbi:hypothetical protein DYB37_005200 [Aphanomyces astaci]|uniref:Uncharacterized protein n=1 Tax=Aphanomyces astaci TaxID=112090 RepID=A0A418CV88_APHAT|nr:hypothetical protein DYB35_013750 [Aphanomyces astaci]RHZ14947.1 hypothetical protein DYB37_005200 [Aphanomyces astaci]